MKRFAIKTNNIGLVFKNDTLQRVMGEGKYWVGFGEKLEVYDLSKTFYVVQDVEVLLTNPDFAEMVTVVEVGDNEIALVYLNGNLKTVLTSGRHFYWNGINKYSFIKVDISNMIIADDINRNMLDKAPLSAFVRNYKIEAFEKALLFVDGKFAGVLEPGNYYWWKNSTLINIAKADTRQLSMEITGQEILTKDKAQLRVNFNVMYRITDVMKALFENKDYEKQLYVSMQLALRAFIGKLTLDELMESKEKIAEDVLAATETRAGEFGLLLNTCGIKDIILPGDVKDIMNQVLIAEKKAQANIITRREETASARSLLNTAKLMEDNAMLYKLKEMEYVEKIAEKINNISLSGGGQIVDQLKQIFVKQ
jgi:hypothetical protein